MKDFLEQTIREAGEIASDYFAKGVNIAATKLDPDDVVSEADKALSKFFTEKIREKYPEHGIQDEEQEDVINPEAEYRWVVDPLDGSRNFAAGIPFWCHLVALRQGEETILGGIYNPISDSFFLAEKGKGAYLNDSKIQVSEQKEIDYGFGICTRTHRRGRVNLYIKVLSHFASNTKARLGNYSTMLGSCYVATGGVDFIVTNGGVDHDYFAPVLLCQEAGAKVTDSDGNPWQAGRSDLVMANPTLHDKIMEQIKIAKSKC
ncbi:MAG: inositol monophosphatase [Parcubacteria group bacterium]|nr:inositol monophosphatase [Parcubacteria group bacterium]